MKLKLIQLILTFILLNLTPFIIVSTSILSNPFLGISPEDEGYFRGESNLMKCRDGSKKINRSQLNDDFCDCLDGSDEPGTSACPNGKFYCRNAGHTPVVLFSSRVNDGICDCCDGSDEYDGKVTCKNTCWEAGKAARDKLVKKIATYEEGVIVRKKEIEEAKVAFAKDEAELAKLKGEEKILKGLVQQLQERKEQIEKQEEKERLEKEKEEKLRKEAEKVSDEGKTEDEKKAEDEIEEYDDTINDKVIGTTEGSTEQDPEEVTPEIVNEESTSDAVEPHVKPEEENNGITDSAESVSSHENKESAPSENTEGLSKEELGRLVASRWTGEKADHETVGSEDVKDTNADETPKDVEDYDGYASDFNDDDHKYDENDSIDHKYDEDDDDDDDNQINDDHTSDDKVSSSYKSDSEDESNESDSSNPSWLEKIQKTVKNILQGFSLFQTPLNTTDAALVRKEYDESSAKLSKIESRISTLSEKLKLDSGPEKEFYSFYGRCFESKQNKYTYKVCPFKKASQDEGHMSTRLGRWEKFEDSYKAMLFSSGDKCWNGPDRSMRVKLRCGLTNEVTDVDEPSRCEYVALLSTPSVCREEKLVELKQKLDALNNQQPPNHDEL